MYTGEFLTKGNEARILQEITEKTERRRRQVWRANSFFASERCGTLRKVREGTAGDLTIDYGPCALEPRKTGNLVPTTMGLGPIRGI